MEYNKLRASQKTEIVQWVLNCAKNKQIELNSAKGVKCLYQSMEFELEPRKRTLDLQHFEILGITRFLEKCAEQGFLIRVETLKSGRKYTLAATIGVTKLQEIKNLDSEIKRLQEIKRLVLKTMN